MSLAERSRDLVGRGRSRVRRKVVWEADRLLSREIPDIERLSRLTPIAASRQEPTLLFDTRDREMGPHVWAESGYDEAELSWVLDHLRHPQRGRTVVEVGANIGTTTVPLLARYGAERVECFEPAPRNLALLRCNLILNQLEDRVIVNGVAISDRDGTVDLELCDWNMGDHRIVATDPSWEVLQESGRDRTPVRCRPLGEALTSGPGEVGLVWVDTQGHEAHVLAGAGPLLGRGIPWVIEYWPYGLTRAGGLDRLHDAIAHHFSSVVDVRASRAGGRVVRLRPDQLPALGQTLGTGYTDLILDGGRTGPEG